MADSRTTPHCVQFVQLPTWFVKLPNGTLRLATEDEAVIARARQSLGLPLEARHA